MENQEVKQQEEMFKEWEKKHRRGKAFGGALIVIIGSLFLARELGAELPHWIFSWKTLLIGIGLMIGVKHRFRSAGWIIPIAIGGVFLLSDIYPALIIKPLLWPILIIVAGLFVIFKPHHHRRNRWHRMQEKRRYKDYYRDKYGNWKDPKHDNWKDAEHADWKEAETYCKTTESTSNEDVVDSVTVMGSVKKNIISKNFKGGEVVVVFGGAELNLSQADFNEQTTLEITQVFGGTRLIIPAHWEIKSELVSVFGSIEDKRPVQQSTSPSNKILVLKGNTFFGGLEIKSY